MKVTAITQAIIDGEQDCDAALEEHIWAYEGQMSIPSMPKVPLAICCANMAWTNRKLNLPDGPMSVADVVEKFRLEPFLPFFDRRRVLGSTRAMLFGTATKPAEFWDAEKSRFWPFLDSMIGNYLSKRWTVQRQVSLANRKLNPERFFRLRLLPEPFPEDDMIALKKPLFSLGRVVATPGAIEALKRAKLAPFQLISRHVAGDWGFVDTEDAEANDQSLVDGSRILSAYKLETGEKIWIITEAANENGDRVATTILLPEEY